MPRPYPKEFREGALGLVRQGDRPIAEIAGELGIAESCLRRWIKQEQLDRRERQDGVTTQEREELRELRRRVRRLEQEKEILRKAAAFFAQRAARLYRSSVAGPSIDIKRVDTADRKLTRSSRMLRRAARSLDAYYGQLGGYQAFRGRLDFQRLIDIVRGANR